MTERVMDRIADIAPLVDRLLSLKRHLDEQGMRVVGVTLGNRVGAIDGVPVSRIVGLPVTISEDPDFVGFTVQA